MRPMKVSRLVRAPAQTLYDAFLDPEALAAWLPPEGMRGEISRFEPWEGGGYRMRLSYESPSPARRGKTEPDADVVDVRFVELAPAARIVQAADFDTKDLAFGGTMTMTWTFTERAAGTEVSVEVENLPPGIREEDHAAGIRSSLENLARFVSG